MLLVGCAALPDVSSRALSSAPVAADDVPLARLAAHAVPVDGLSGFQLLVSGADSLQARLGLIEHAQVSLDLQYYQFKTDASGRRLMRALRDAAARGVHVRVLLDDLYTAGDDPWWLGLAAHANLEVRLFNPFLSARDSHLSRLVDAAIGAPRLHRRMHNKLFIADGVLAIAGGRNIGDAYFLRDAQQGFFDIDVLVAGAVLPQMVQAFDRYWNSDYSHELPSVVDEPMRPADRRADFVQRLVEDCSAGNCSMPGPVALDTQQHTLAQQIAQGRLALQLAPARVAVDSLSKFAQGAPVDFEDLPVSGSQVRLLVAQTVRQAEREMVVVSPYLIPGRAGVDALRGFRQRGVRVVLLTNSLAATDEPLVHLGYRKYRVAILREGIELYEWSPASGGRVLRELVAGGVVLRLHAKCAVVDRRWVYLGSMNFDPRSRDWNTEFGLLIDSPALAADVLALIDRLNREAAYRLQLAADGSTLRWIGRDGREAGHDAEPDTDLGSRLLLDLLAPFVPEEML